MTPYEEKLLRDRIAAQTSQLRAPVTLGSRVNAQLQQPIPPGMMNQSAGRPVAPAGAAALKAQMMRSQERGATGRALATADMPQGKTVNGLYLAPGWGELIGAGAQKLAGAHLVGKSRKEGKDLEKKAAGLEQATAEYEAELADFENEQSLKQALDQIDYRIDASNQAAKDLEDHKDILERNAKGDTPFEGTSQFAQSANAKWPQYKEAGWTMQQYRAMVADAHNQPTRYKIGDTTFTQDKAQYADPSVLPGAEPPAGAGEEPTEQRAPPEVEVVEQATAQTLETIGAGDVSADPGLLESFAQEAGWDTLATMLRDDDRHTDVQKRDQWVSVIAKSLFGGDPSDDQLERISRAFFPAYGDSEEDKKGKATLRADMERNLRERKNLREVWDPDKQGEQDKVLKPTKRWNPETQRLEDIP